MHHPLNILSLFFSLFALTKDLNDRKSTTGLLFMLNGGPLSWSSRKQTVTAQSTTEAEIIALNEAAKEAAWLVRILEEIEEEQRGAVPLHCYNQSTVRLVRNNEFHSKTKHIAVKYFPVRELESAGTISVKDISTDEQPADIFTKPLAAPRIQLLRNLIGVQENSS